MTESYQLDQSLSHSLKMSLIMFYLNLVKILVTVTAQRPIPFSIF